MDETIRPKIIDRQGGPRDPEVPDPVEARKNFDAFSADVQEAMDPEELTELDDLGSDQGARTDFVVAKALDIIEHEPDSPLLPKLTDTVRSIYRNDPKGERFIVDPTSYMSDHNNPIAVLLVDNERNLVSARGVQLARIQEGVQGAGDAYISKITWLKVLSGPQAGQEFDSSEYPLPYPDQVKKEG